MNICTAIKKLNDFESYNNELKQVMLLAKFLQSSVTIKQEPTFWIKKINPKISKLDLKYVLSLW